LAYAEGREFGEELFSVSGRPSGQGARQNSANIQNDSGHDLQSLQSQIAAESLELGVLKARVAQVEAQRDQMGRDLEIVRGWIDQLQRSESLRIGKVLTAPGRLVKRFAP
jgi:chromosome segregation ATPase